jgi:hypothetical protein
MSNIRTLILSDLHNNWDRAEKIIKHVAPDKIVFLGDYFDNWGDDYRIATETADWLGSSLEQKNRIHLMGNHDTNYAFGHRSYKCSGYEAGKDYAINALLSEDDWRKLPLHTWVGSWLCSHAGVHNHFYTKYGSGKDFKAWLTETCDEALQVAFAGKPAVPILMAGMSRGGRELHGGIDWCDADEFEPVPGVNQIFGHTPQQKPRWITTGSPLSLQHSRNLCLDVSHCCYYVIHDSNDDQNIKIKWFGDL